MGLFSWPKLVPPLVLAARLLFLSRHMLRLTRRRNWIATCSRVAIAATSTTPRFFSLQQNRLRSFVVGAQKLAEKDNEATGRVTLSHSELLHSALGALS
jgi:hypothetical protein